MSTSWLSFWNDEPKYVKRIKQGIILSHEVIRSKLFFVAQPLIFQIYWWDEPNTE